MAALFSTWKKAGAEVVVKQVSSPAALNKEWKKKEIAYIKVLADQRDKFTAVVGEIYNGTSDEGKALLRSPSVDAVKKNPGLVQDLVKQLGSHAVPGFRFLDANINKFSSGANTSGSIAAAFGLIKGLVPAEEPASTTEAAAAPASASELKPADKVEDASASTVVAATGAGATAGESGADAKEVVAEAGAAGLEMIDKAPTYQRQKSIHDDYVAIDQDTIALFLQSQGDNEEEGGEEAGKATDASKKALAASTAALAAGAAGISSVVKSPGAAPTPSSTPTGVAEVPAIAALPSPTASSPLADTATSLSAAAAAALNEVPTPLAELGSDAPTAAASATETLSEKVESAVASAKDSVTSSVAASAEAVEGALAAPGGPSVDAAVDSLTSSASAAAESLKDSVSKSVASAVGPASGDAATATAAPTDDAAVAEVAAAATEKPKTLLDLAPPSDSLPVPGADTLEKGVAAAAADVAKVATDVEASVVEVAGSAASDEKKVIAEEVLETAGTSTTTVESVTTPATEAEAEGAKGAPGESSPSVQSIIKKLQGSAAVASPAAALEAAAPVIEDVASKAGVSAATTEKGIQGVKSVVAKFEEVSKSATTSPALKPLAADVAVESIDAKMEGAADAATEAAPAAAAELATKVEEKVGEAGATTAAVVAVEEGATKTETTEKTAGAEAPLGTTANAKLEDAKTDAPVAPTKHKRTSSFNFITRFLKEEAAKSQPPVVMEVSKENENLNPIVPPKSHRRSGSLALFGCFSKSKTVE